MKMKPRILLVGHSSGIYGAEKCLLTLAKYLDRERYEIVVSCPDYGPMWDELGKLAVGRIKLSTASCLMARFRLIRSILRFPIHLYNVWRSVLLLKNGKFDLVHCNSMASLEAAVAGKVLGVPVVIHCREFLKDAPHNFVGGWKMAYRLVDSLSDRVICMSRAVQEVMVEAGCNRQKTAVIYDGFEMEHNGLSSSFEETEQKASSKCYPVIGCVAGIHPRKGHVTLLQAFSIVVRTIPNARLLIIGGGKKGYIRKLKKLTSQLGIDSATQFLGELTQVGDIYRQFTLFALPSYGEAYGLVYGEAALHGIPAIGTSSGGAPEIIENGVTGFIVPPKDPEQLAKAMLRILVDDKLAAEMGRRAKQRMQALFPSRKIITDVEQIYEELLKRRV